MNLLPCPWCGEREETEFHFGGEKAAIRPSFGCTDAEWANYLYLRENPQGRADELWCHSWGCGEWFVVSRDTVSHEVSSAEAFADTPTKAPE